MIRIKGKAFIQKDYDAGCSSFDVLRQIYNRNVAKTSNKLLSCTILFSKKRSILRGNSKWVSAKHNQWHISQHPITLLCPLFQSKYKVPIRPEVKVQICNGVSIHGAFLHLRTKGIALTSLDIVEFKLPFKYRLIYCGLEMKQILFGFLELDCIFELYV